MLVYIKHLHIGVRNKTISYHAIQMQAQCNYLDHHHHHHHVGSLHHVNFADVCESSLLIITSLGKWHGWMTGLTRVPEPCHSDKPVRCVALVGVGLR